MAWRLHLTNQSIQSLDILEGDPPLLAAWSRRDRVAYYDLKTGTVLGEQELERPDTQNRQDESWQAYLTGLTAPNGAYLPAIQLTNGTLYLTDDGRMRLYYTGSTDLYLQNDDKEVLLEVSNVDRFVAVTLDRFLGLTAALDDAGKLHIYQQHINVGEFDLGLSLQDDLRPKVVTSRGGGAIFITDGQDIVLTDSSGRVRKRIDTHFTIHQMACSPSGNAVIICDADVGVIRVYKGHELTLTHQRFAIDLVAAATQIQLLADLPPTSVAPSAVAINNEGVLAFAMSGVICVTDISYMDEVPRPQALL